MKELSGTARNYFFTESGEDEFRPVVELIIVVSEPTYRLGEAEVVKERKSEHYRICTNRDGVALLMKELVDIDKDLEKMESKKEDVR